MFSQNPQEDNSQKDTNDFKKKRDEYNVEIRKKKREDLLTKKRNTNLEINQRIQEGQDSMESKNLATNPELKHMIDEWLNRDYSMAEFGQLVEATCSDDKIKQHFGAIGLRKLLSNENGVHIQDVIDANMVPRLIQFMQDESEPHLQMEAAWALTNIASGTSHQTQCIIDKGGIVCFINLLKSGRTLLAEQAVWALGNIAGDNHVFRDMILQYGGLQPLLDVVNKTSNELIIKQGTWAISNLCRGKPAPKIDKITAALPTMSAVIQQRTDIEVLTDAMWALSYLTRVDSQIQPAIETGMIPALIRHLDNPHMALHLSCLRTIGNIVAGSVAQTDEVLRYEDFLPKVFKFMTHKKKTVRREACWVLSNITAGEARQIELVVGVPEYLNAIMERALLDEGEVQKEATFALSNATKHSSPQIIVHMINSGVLDCFIKLMDSKQSDTIQIVLEAINNILGWGVDASQKNKTYDNEFLRALEERGGVKKIEDLQSHPVTEVYLKALKILEHHCELESML